MTDTIFTTLAPTARINTMPRPLSALAREVDRIQNDFNTALVSTLHRPAMLPISNCLYDIFTLLEQQCNDAPAMLVKLLATVKSHELRSLAMMQDLENAISELVGAYPALFADEPEYQMEYPF